MSVRKLLKGELLLKESILVKMWSLGAPFGGPRDSHGPEECLKKSYSKMVT